ncbi:MAG: hypothetical protein IPK19_15440 [Chloroflexi bacterium]|nr:hypothetical protein [Chloroflexota bacterium]
MKKLVTTSQSIVSDVAHAETLDASWYLDPAICDQEVERIFARTWQCAARIEQLARPGDTFTTEIADETIPPRWSLRAEIQARSRLGAYLLELRARGLRFVIDQVGFENSAVDGFWFTLRAE